MILFEYPLFTKSTWKSAENDTWSLGWVDWDPSWFYLGNTVWISCDVTTEDFVFVEGHEDYRAIKFNGHIRTDNGAAYPGSNTAPFRMISLVEDAALNQSFHFIHKFSVQNSHIEYDKTNHVQYQNINFRVDYVKSGKLTISNLRIVDQASVHSSICENGNVVCSAISNQQSAISNQQSAISNQQSAISNQQSAQFYPTGEIYASDFWEI